MSRKHASFWLILTVPILAVIAWWYFIWQGAVNPPHVEGVGVFGDSFGVLSALFNGLAFAGLIITILLQREELQLQRKELAGQREETKRLADAQTRSEEALRQQALLSALAALVQAELAQGRNRAPNYNMLEEVEKHLRGQLERAGIQLRS